MTYIKYKLVTATTDDTSIINDYMT